MGVVSSADKKHRKAHINFKKHASNFSLADVQRALVRFATLYSSTSTFLIGRREYVEVFTDYDFSLVQQGQFLSLPLEVFSFFDIEQSGIVDIRELFSLLSLHCNSGSVAEKLGLLFPLFGSQMTEERVSQLLSAFQRGLFRVGILEEKYPTSFVTSLSAKICGEGAWRRIQTISAQLLSDWMLNSEELKEVLNELCDGQERVLSNKYTLITSKDNIKANGAVLKREVRRLLAASQSAPALKSAKKNKRGNRASASEGRKSQVNRKTETQPAPPRMVSNENAVAPGELDACLAKLNPDDLKALLDVWEKNKSSKKGLSHEKFSQIMHIQFPSISNAQVLNKMFEVFDRNQDGFLDFEEFMLGISRIASVKLEDKIRFLFDVANAQGGRFSIGDQKDIMEHESTEDQMGKRKTKMNLSSQGQGNSNGEPAMKLMDLVRLIQDTNNEMVECAHFVELVISMMDYDKNGIVEREEFTRAVEELPTLLESFDECFKPSRDMRRHVQLLADASPEFEPQQLIDAWVGLGFKKKQFMHVDWENFVEFMEPIWDGAGGNLRKHMQERKHSRAFNFSPTALPTTVTTESQSDAMIYTHLLNLFRAASLSGNAVDENGSVIDMRKVLIGIMLCIESGGVLEGSNPVVISRQQKAQLYFELFDVDCSGEVDYHEFFELVYASQLDLQDAGWKAVETLRCLDLDGDGIITFPEFMKAIRKHKSILESFGRIFNASILDELDKKDAQLLFDESCQDIISEEEEPEAEQASNTVVEGTQDTKKQNNNDGNDKVNGKGKQGTENRDEEDLSKSQSAPVLSSPTSARGPLGSSASAPALLPLNAVYRTTYAFRKNNNSGLQLNKSKPESSEEGATSPKPSLSRQGSKLGAVKPANKQPSRLTKQMSRANINHAVGAKQGIANKPRKLDPL